MMRDMAARLRAKDEEVSALHKQLADMDALVRNKQRVINEQELMMHTLSQENVTLQQRLSTEQPRTIQVENLQGMVNQLRMQLHSANEALARTTTQASQLAQLLQSANHVALQLAGAAPNAPANEVTKQPVKRKFKMVSEL